MLLELKGISKHFGGVAAVKNVSFQVERGSICALIGPNGAGKTTVFNLISGNILPDKGEIELNEKGLKGLKPYEIAARGVTRTFQNLQLFGGMTVIENVMTGAYLRGKQGFLNSLLCLPGKDKEEKRIREEAMVLLEDIGLQDMANLPAAALPFGQQRLLEIARSLAANPDLILLDEPAAGLNSTETRDLAHYLKSLKMKGISMLLIEHDMETVMDAADKIIVLNYGSVIAEGRPAEVQTHPEVIKAYLGEDDEIA